MRRVPTTHESHPDVLRRLRRAIGQLNSVVQMIASGQPCLDVSQQLQAAESAITQAKKAFIHDHIDHCLGQGRTISKATMREFKTISKYL